uniref:Histone deacetylase n=1 Tax=Chromera velia CCMP2878 TaxID=1169474 RepID=A0A0G4IDU1_9ALVE|eukprot:Cvel_13407.t1-p1 / transcript=Cvel_13407.t1 / gene=Cvel_13407 / organism=Chromera_velia_CCMP2878 / gene_product=Histone deacetylase 1, putative / transcript_product=Histone deacetylase 1, putative / location=Cvel_scaffold914:7324-14171(+) / protein_length=473 / sequence_SO=supercontig / SO=protein_coding / is_pseudo=false
MAGPLSSSDEKKRTVAYLYDADIGSYYYGQNHPMKPQRMRMAHELILSYELYSKMEVYEPHRALPAEIEEFHSPDYVDFLSKVTPEYAKGDWLNHMRNFGVGDDCPIFEGLFEFQASCSGASIDAAYLLNRGHADIAINWSGGLHHAKKSEASGFCYLNDIVLGILELLKYHARVMYIDIDIHHGDGVEEAFFSTSRVLTVSFHKFGDFFPGTGDVTDVGAGEGKFHSLNVPLSDGMDDASFEGLFKPIIAMCIQRFRPGAIVLQCGADSLTQDRLGKFNLTVKGHAECVKFVRAFNIPLMVLGGGGYTIRNVARCWAFETGTCLGVEESMPTAIPVNDYIEYYAPNYELHLDADPTFENLNTPQTLDKLRIRALEHLREMEHVPGVGFSQCPGDFFDRDTAAHDKDDRRMYTVGWEGGGRSIQHQQQKLGGEVVQTRICEPGVLGDLESPAPGLRRKKQNQTEFYDEEEDEF